LHALIENEYNDPDSIVEFFKGSDWIWAGEVKRDLTMTTHSITLIAKYEITNQNRQDLLDMIDKK
jgi:hypothetical protein